TMRLMLSNMRADMFKEGYDIHFIATQVYRGTEHQDGRTLLAVRRFLKAVHAAHPLRNVTLIGDFPEASIVRQVFVRSHVGAEGKLFGGVNYANTDFVDTGTELVAPRSDLVLSDLDGNWEALYRKEYTTFRDVELVPELDPWQTWPAAGQYLSSVRFNIRTSSFQDFFLITDRDTRLIENAPPGRATVHVQSLTEPGPELSSSDRLLANPIARPEIAVTRINPRHVALQPWIYNGYSVDGQGPLAADGKPRTVRLTAPTDVMWKEDATLERKILLDYLYRNHTFRLGHDRNKPYRTSAVRARESGLLDPVSFNNILRKADPTFAASLSVPEADMAEYINWLKEPAVLRGIAAHSDQVSAGFKQSNTWLVDTMIGGRPWFWKLSSDAQGYYLQPTLGERTSADFFLYRTLWENKIYETMSTGQTFYIHDGCSVNAVLPVYDRYNTPLYAARQHAESMLFYANGLGMLARAKVFNDTPRNVTETIASTKRFAAGLSGYFNADASDATLNPAGTTDPANRRTRTLQRKRTYFWGLLGDATLLIKY
ncbi:MAG TPA: hypothetical protein VK524_07885, partial [Polyangiaceae bacterium]|nr:hypothetical protein [Polyangiaceae bacterium]